MSQCVKFITMDALYTIYTIVNKVSVSQFSEMILEIEREIKRERDRNRKIYRDRETDKDKENYKQTERH